MLKSLFGAHTFSHAAQLLGLAGAGLALFGDTQVVAACVIVLAVISYVVHLVLARRERKIATSKVDDLLQSVDLDRIVRHTAEVLGLGAQGQGWRLSLYRLELAGSGDSDDHWKMVARAANQEIFERSTDFARLGLRQGVLRSAVNAADSLAGGVDEMPPLPDPLEEPAAWQSMMAAWGMEPGSTPTSMMSRVYCGRVFRVGLNRANSRGMTLALVAESESPTGVRKHVMEEALTRPVFELFYELLTLRGNLQRDLAEALGR